MFKRIAFVLLIIMMGMVLSSCSLGKGISDMWGVRFNDDSTVAEKLMERVVNAINNKDSEALYALFSQDALNSPNNAGNTAQDLFDFIDGEVISFEKDNGLIGSAEIRHGKYRNKISSFFFIITESQKYCIQLIDYSKDTITPSNQGLYLLCVVKEDDDNVHMINPKKHSIKTE